MSRQAELFQPGKYFKPPPPPVKRPLRELSQKEQEKVVRIKAQVMEYMPDMAPLFNELHKAGMIDGWRSVGEVVLFDAHPSTGSGRTDILKGNEHVIA